MATLALQSRASAWIVETCDFEDDSISPVPELTAQPPAHAQCKGVDGIERRVLRLSRFRVRKGHAETPKAKRHSVKQTHIETTNSSHGHDKGH